MSAKLKKVLSHMKKIEDKMVLLQEKWNELNKQKTEFAYRSKSGVPFLSEKQEEIKNEEI